MKKRDKQKPTRGTTKSLSTASRCHLRTGAARLPGSACPQVTAASVQPPPGLPITSAQPPSEKGAIHMIEVTRLNDTKLLINSDQIEFVEETPDTVISFLSGKKIIVKESRQEIQNLVILYRKKILKDCLIFRDEPTSRQAPASP